MRQIISFTSVVRRLKAPVLLTVALLTLSASRLEAADTDEWEVSQQHWNMGQSTVFVTKSAIKIQTQEGLNIICKAPDWQVSCFRSDEKLLWHGKLSQFGGFVMFNSFIQPEIKKGLTISAGHCKYLGVDCEKWKDNRSNNDYTLCSKDMVLDRHAAEFIYRYYELPCKETMPLYRCEYTDQKPKSKESAVKEGSESYLVIRNVHPGRSVILKTLALKKQAVNPAQFEVPKGFRVTKDLREVALSHRQQNDLSDLMHEIGFSSTAARK